MIVEGIWLVKMLLSHLLTDFLLQPGSWVADRKKNHFASGKLYLHGLITGAVALIFLAGSNWLVALIIMVTHIAIDGWKSYQRDSIQYFIADQLLHLLVIFSCWCFLFVDPAQLLHTAQRFSQSTDLWILLTGAVFLTNPAGILIGQVTKGWREKIANPESLANAGKWIGIIERIIVYLLVLVGQYAAISLLIAAKGIIRFNEKDRPEVKTEYLVIGTLMSIALAMVVGITVKKIFLSLP